MGWFTINCVKAVLNDKISTDDLYKFNFKECSKVYTKSCNNIWLYVWSHLEHNGYFCLSAFNCICDCYFGCKIVVNTDVISLINFIMSCIAYQYFQVVLWEQRLYWEDTITVWLEVSHCCQPTVSVFWHLHVSSHQTDGYQSVGWHLQASDHTVQQYYLDLPGRYDNYTWISN